MTMRGNSRNKIIIILFACTFLSRPLNMFWPITLSIIIIGLFYGDRKIPTIDELTKKFKSRNNTDLSVTSNEIVETKLPFTYSDNPRAKYCEFLVSRYLSTLDKKFYTVINNVTLTSTGGNTTNTQIDHIVVSRYGIFCIETKSHRGWVYCKENERYWLQILPKSSNEFYSPSRQNFAHTRALKSLLGPRLIGTVVPIIVFTSADVIMKVGKINVGNIGYMLREIDKHKTLIYSRYEYERIVNIIQHASKNDTETAYQHKVEVSDLVASLSV